MKNSAFPRCSVLLLLVVLLGCAAAELIMTDDPTFMDPSQINKAPSGDHFFGTDSLGRDIFSIIWSGGRMSLVIGLLATLISSVIAIMYGCISALANSKIDDLLMRFSEILMSIPQILLVLFCQAIIGEANLFTIAAAIGISGWMAIAKMVRSEMKRIRRAEYILAAKSAGGKFFYLLWNHYMPNFMPAIMFMIVTNLGSAIALEATLSFLGLGLPTEVLSWGSLLSLSQKAMLTGSWWQMIIPGIFLVVTIVSITEIGEQIRKVNGRESL